MIRNIPKFEFNLTLKAAKDLHKVNSKALITFVSPKHGSFKSNTQVQAMLRIEGF